MRTLYALGLEPNDSVNNTHARWRRWRAWETLGGVALLVGALLDLRVGVAAAALLAYGTWRASASNTRRIETMEFYNQLRYEALRLRLDVPDTEIQRLAEAVRWQHGMHDWPRVEDLCREESNVWFSEYWLNPALRWNAAMKAATTQVEKERLIRFGLEADS